jgi:2-haloalkanoic acid dehalogenase type II
MPRIKAIFFDFMGTCLDWHTGVLSTLPQSIPSSTRSDFALHWRQAYFDSNASRLAVGLPPEEIDITLLSTLKSTIQADRYKQYIDLFNDSMLKECVNIWHSMPAWPEVPLALSTLQAKGYETFVFANGTPRLQLDLCKSSGLKFSMLFSSLLLGVYKPAPESYTRVMDMVGVRPEEGVMVAAHAYDLRGAKGTGMRTVYVERWTDDVLEDREAVKREFDFWMGDMGGLVDVIERM